MGGSRIREGRHFKVIRRWVEGMKGTGEDVILLVYPPCGVSFGKKRERELSTPNSSLTRWFFAWAVGGIKQDLFFPAFGRSRIGKSI